MGERSEPGGRCCGELCLIVFLRTFSPPCGIATRVEAPDDDDLRLLDDVVERVRESSEREPPNVAMHDRESSGVVGQEVDGNIDNREKLLPEFTFGPLVPSGRFGEISLR